MIRTRLAPRSWLAAALLAAAALAGCGGGSSDGNQNPRVTYGKMVVFGDSLSDVGTYRVSGVALLGGGEYTVNGADSPIWVERIARQLGVDAPCAAQTGLNANEALIGFPPAPVTDVDGCYGYAQGGARVIELIGPGNAALLTQGDPGGALGQLTDPIVNQITRHLAVTATGKFEADDLVAVQGGGNDALMNLAAVQATATAGGDVAAASAAAIAAMDVAGAQLAKLITTQLVANGASRVVVQNLPNLAGTPFAATLDETTRALVLTMVTTFNTSLAEGLNKAGGVVLVDLYADSLNHAADPARYGLSNVTTPACDAAKVATSLFCTADTLIAGDTSRYEFADGVHPSPYGYQLYAQAVALQMARAGWL